jgi:hypothetical protein
MRLAWIVVAACGSGSSSTPPPPAEQPKPVEHAKPKLPPLKQPDRFAGFAKDSQRFAWITPSLTGKLSYLKTIVAGDTEPQQKVVFPDPEAQKELDAALAAFSTERRAVPDDVTLEADLAATPPTLRLVRGGASVAVPIGQAPYPPTDQAELWGTSADGKRVAIHITGPDVPGTFSKGGGPDFHFFFVAMLP